MLNWISPDMFNLFCRGFLISENRWMLCRWNSCLHQTSLFTQRSTSHHVIFTSIPFFRSISDPCSWLVTIDRWSICLARRGCIVELGQPGGNVLVNVLLMFVKIPNIYVFVFCHWLWTGLKMYADVSQFSTLIAFLLRKQSHWIPDVTSKSSRRQRKYDINKTFLVIEGNTQA